MKKKSRFRFKKFKKSQILVLAIVGFFVLYLISFKMSRGYIINHKSEDASVISEDNNEEKNEIQKQIEVRQKEEEKKGALQRFNECKKAYISDEQVGNIKIEGTTLDTLKRSMDSFVKIRSIDDDFKPKNEMKSNNNIVIKTDFNYIEVKSDKKLEYYKIPVSEKKDFKSMFRRMIYTSVEFITNGDKIGKIKLYSGNQQKRVLFWQKKDLIRKIMYKREVGKIQPEKEFGKTKKNYTIKIEKSGVEIAIQTMGRDFIKVSCGDNVAYYEVFPELYNYLASKFDN